MRYIELQDGILLDTNCIEGIKKIDDSTCEIYTHHRKYLSTVFTYEVLVSMLKNDDSVTRNISDNEKIQSTMSKLDKVLNQSQHFAG